MKVAITSTGNSPESFLDRRFGRCAWFIIYDPQDGSMEIIPNPNRDAEEQAGPASVHLIAGRNAGRIISGEFGLRIKDLLDSMKIQLIVIKDRKIRISEIIEMLNRKNKKDART